MYFPIFDLLAVEYSLVSSGTCQSNNRDEVPQADCETAAVALGLSDTSVTVETDDRYPPGCYKYRNDDKLYFNLADSSAVNCGNSGDNCICEFDHSNGGSVSPSF